MNTTVLVPEPLTAWSGPRVSRAHPMVKRLIAATFPEYRGRIIELRAWTPRQLDNYWSGGSRSYWRMVRLADGGVAEPGNDNPFRAEAHVEVDLPDGCIAVEHRISNGHDLGLRIYARLDPTPALTTLLEAEL